jgi:hypothetical protein
MTSSADHEHNRKSGSHCGRDCVQVDPQQTSALSLASGAVPSAPNGDSLGSCGNRVNERAYPPPLHQSVAIRTRCTLVSKYGCFLEASKRAPQAQTAVPALHVEVLWMFSAAHGFRTLRCFFGVPGGGYVPVQVESAPVHRLRRYPDVATRP